ncbi:hypothetical protein T09_14373 [Trichinella sp. T9]|nr:hypothetical protein T09_14373 [Trichinella sp. T9]
MNDFSRNMLKMNDFGRNMLKMNDFGRNMLKPRYAENEAISAEIC